VTRLSWRLLLRKKSAPLGDGKEAALCVADHMCLRKILFRARSVLTTAARAHRFSDISGTGRVLSVGRSGHGWPCQLAVDLFSSPRIRTCHHRLASCVINMAHGRVHHDRCLYAMSWQHTSFHFYSRSRDHCRAPLAFAVAFLRVSRSNGLVIGQIMRTGRWITLLRHSAYQRAAGSPRKFWPRQARPLTSHQWAVNGAVGAQ